MNKIQTKQWLKERLMTLDISLREIIEILKDFDTKFKEE